ncbi:MAG: hypothetical protein MJE68_00885 [Proteobacteria bacterium]|nr:hypothetical protein [Pseudomonadota bacterium]
MTDPEQSAFFAQRGGASYASNSITLAGIIVDHLPDATTAGGDTIQASV